MPSEVTLTKRQKEIAKQLALRNQTVRNTLVQIRRKTNTRNRTQLAMKVLSSG